MALAVRVRCFNGEVYDLKCDAGDSVQSFQEKIEAASGIAADRQTLLFKGQVLEGDKSLEDFNVNDGVVVNVVRKVGKSSSATSTAAAPPAAPASATAPTPTTLPQAKTREASAAAPDFSGLGGMAGMPGMAGMEGLNGYEDLIKSLQSMGGMGGAGGAGGMNPFLGGANPADLMKQFGAGQGGPNQMQDMMQQFKAVSNIFQTPEMQDFLKNPEKMEDIRKSLKDNPFMKQFIEKDENIMKTVEDPEKWQEYMKQTLEFLVPGGDAGAPDGGTAAPPTTGDRSAPGGSGPSLMSSAMGMAPVAQGKPAEGAKSIAEMIPPGLDHLKLAEAYGHALGQSLINSAMGLDPDAVVKGLKSACDGGPFPMRLPDYERQMRTLQTVAAQYLADANLEDAERFFEETQKDEKIHVLKPNRIIWEACDAPPADDAPVATSRDEVLVILEGRLLDGRVFFTCPAADDTGETVHPLSLPLETAPMALAEGIVGMKEGESRTLYVHPANCEGMTDMFGELLPPNAMLSFDIELVSCNASDADKQPL